VAQNGGRHSPGRDQGGAACVAQRLAGARTSRGGRFRFSDHLYPVGGGRRGDRERRHALAQNEDELVVDPGLASGEGQGLEDETVFAAHRAEIVEERVRPPHVEVDAVVHVEEEPHALRRIRVFGGPPRLMALDIVDPVDKVIPA